MEYTFKHYATITYAVNGIDVMDKVSLDPSLDPVTQTRDRVEAIRLTNEATVYTIGECYEYEPVFVDKTVVAEPSE